MTATEFVLCFLARGPTQRVFLTVSIRGKLLTRTSSEPHEEFRTLLTWLLTSGYIRCKFRPAINAVVWRLHKGDWYKTQTELAMFFAEGKQKQEKTDMLRVFTIREIIALVG